MARFKIGIVLVDEQSAFAHRFLAATTESLKALGCSEQNILVHHAPRIPNVPLVVQFFAEYTDVDAVVVLLEPNQSAEYSAMLYGVGKVQITWNMPVVIGDCTAAAEAIDMISMQNEMESATAEHTSTESREIN